MAVRQRGCSNGRGPSGDVEHHRPHRGSRGSYSAEVSRIEGSRIVDCQQRHSAPARQAIAQRARIERAAA